MPLRVSVSQDAFFASVEELFDPALVSRRTLHSRVPQGSSEPDWVQPEPCWA